MLYGVDSGFEENRVSLLLSMHRQQAIQSIRRQGISSATGHTTKRHLYRLKGLNLLSLSMQVLIGMVERSTNGNGKQGGVAIVDDLKNINNKGKVTCDSQSPVSTAVT